MFSQLVDIYSKPQPFAVCTTHILWNDAHISKNMLAAHLDEQSDQASRNRAFLNRSIDWIAGHFAIGAGSRVCDFGCGPGLYTLGLAEKGAGVTGLDFSERSIAFARDAARAKGLSIRYVLGNYLEFETEEKFDLISMIYCDFCALSPAQRQVFLQKCRGMLKEGGALLFDAYLLHGFEKWSESARVQHFPAGGFWSEREYFEFVNSFKYDAEKVTLDKYTLVQPDRIWQVYNWLQYFSLETLAAEVEAGGLQIVEKFADVAGAPFSDEADEFAVVVKLR